MGKLHLRPAPEEWLAIEVMAHLHQYVGRVHLWIAAEERPTIRAINPRTWMKKTDYPELEFRSSLKVFMTQCEELLALDRLAEANWQRRLHVLISCKEKSV